MPKSKNKQSSKVSKSSEEKNIKCKGCGKEVTLLLSHLERTKSTCQNSYDMNALREKAKILTKERKAQRSRERYHSNPQESAKKKESMRVYNSEHRAHINECMAKHYDVSKRDRNALREKAQKSRERYHSNPQESAKKKESMTVYNSEHRAHINESLAKHYDVRRMKVDDPSWRDKLLKCHICEKEFCDEKILKRHVSQIHSNEQPPLSCQICDKAIQFQYNLNRHMREVHGQEKRFKCPECPEVFAREEHLDKHQERGNHTIQSDCEYCDESLLCKSDAEENRKMKKHKDVNGSGSCKCHDDSCIKFHCINEKNVSDKKREELLQKRLERHYYRNWEKRETFGEYEKARWEEGKKRFENNWEYRLSRWRDELKKHREEEEAKKKTAEERRKNSFYCRYCKTAYKGIFESQHKIGWRGCGCKGCNVVGDNHDFRQEFKMDDCPLHTRICDTYPYNAMTLREWKEKVDSGEWKVDATSYEKYVTLLKNHDEKCANNC